MARFVKGSGIAPRDANGKQHYPKKERTKYGPNPRRCYMKAIQKLMDDPYYSKHEDMMLMLRAGYEKAKTYEMDFKKAGDKVGNFKFMFATAVLHEMDDALRIAHGGQPIRIGRLPGRDMKLQKHLRCYYRLLFPKRALPRFGL